MHDPMTVAWEIKSPFKKKCQMFPGGYRNTWATIWHVDPEKDGTDDSCGWFQRSRHGCKETLAKIEREFDFEFGQKQNDELAHCRWFNPDGSPRLSPIAITLQMFHRAYWSMYPLKYKRKERFMRRHLAEFIHFAENNVDSLWNSIDNRYKEKREDRIKSFASIIYAYILRLERPWYRHPRWHIHHWKIQIHLLQKIKRYLFERCCVCGKGYSWGYFPTGNWNGDKTWHGECGNSVPGAGDRIN